MTKLEEIARSICAAIAIANNTTGMDSRGQIIPRAEFIDISWRLYLGHAAFALTAMRDYSEAMSQAGGAVGKYGHIPVDANNPPIGQGVAERAYLAMIDAALYERPE